MMITKRETDCKFEIIAPFVPKDEEIVNLPAIYLVCTINRFIDRCVKKDDDRIITVFFDARIYRNTCY